LQLATGDEDTGRMVDQADDPAVPAADRDDAMRDQEGDQRDRRGSERRARCGRAPADDRADRDGNREIERAELSKRAPFPQTQADNGHREKQDSLDRHPSQTARATDQLRHLCPPPLLTRRSRTRVHAATATRWLNWTPMTGRASCGATAARRTT